jgi:hypothetical protein
MHLQPIPLPFANTHFLPSPPFNFLPCFFSALRLSWPWCLLPLSSAQRTRSETFCTCSVIEISNPGTFTQRCGRVASDSIGADITSVAGDVTGFGKPGLSA